jgi:hypothetical protein
VTSTAAKSTDTCCHMPLTCESTGSTSLISARKLINSNVQIMLNKPFAVASLVLKAQRKHTGVVSPNRSSRVHIPPHRTTLPHLLLALASTLDLAFLSSVRMGMNVFIIARVTLSCVSHRVNADSMILTIRSNNLSCSASRLADLLGELR